MSGRISFRCPSCDARIKAPVELLGQSRKCPRCANKFRVKIPTPADAQPMMIEGNEKDLSKTG